MGEADHKVHGINEMLDLGSRPGVEADTCFLGFETLIRK